MTRQWTSTVPARTAIVVALVLAAPLMCAASDSFARSGIFREQHVEGSALDIHRAVAKLPSHRRYDRLAGWLLPGPDHAALRVQAAFAPTDPGPFDRDREGNRQPSIDPVGGVIVSPLFDLLDAAHAIGRLDDIRERISRWNVDGLADPGRRDDAAVSRQAVLALIELADGRTAEAIPHAEQVLDLTFVDANSTADLEPSDAALLLMSRGVAVPELRELAGSFLARCDRWVKSTSQRSPKQRHVAALIEQLRVVDAGGAGGGELGDAATAMQQWRVVTRTTARSRGAGWPSSHWVFQPGQVENVACHDIDYLYLNVPLLGDFDIECDVSVDGWRASSISVGGLWLGPVYHLAGFDSGNFRWQRPRTEFSPPLTRVRHWVHYRTTVRDGVITAYFNGRPIHTEELPAGSDPWLAIRNMPRNAGRIRNLRITGSPGIPESIDLLGDVALRQWCPYFDDSVGDAGDHWVLVNGELLASRDAEPLEFDAPNDGSEPTMNETLGWRESLLRYHRPLLEDGVLAYEFFYSPGEFHAHPALDRLAFLLAPGGVRIHQITDGPFDQTGLSPANAFDEPEHHRGPAKLPFKPNGWNRLELRLDGDIVTLVLNGVEIFERPLEAGNQRSFGLFHFADRTGVRVRNIVWRGNWPRELPPVSQQELAIPAAEFLDVDSDRLAATFQHDFTSDGLPVERFSIVRGTPEIHLKPTTDGLLATRDGTGGYLNATIAPALQISGDFDVVVEYDRFEAETADDGSATVALLANLDNASNDEYWVGRRHYPRANGTIEQIVNCVVVRRLPEGEQRQYFVTEPMEERSGRLRLARRGNRIYYLTAEADSPNWLLRGEKPVASDPVATDGLRLFTQIHQKGGAVSVDWKRLQIRAEGLSGRAISGNNAELTELNAQRDRLPKSFLHDFRQQAPTPERFYQWNIPGDWKPTDAGWLIVAPGADSWTSSGAEPPLQVAGDFDVSVQFDPQQMATPKPGKHTQVYLQIEAPDQARTQVNSIFTVMPDGERVATAQVRELKDGGGFNYRPLGHIGMPTVRRLRLCRRGSTVTFLAASAEDSADQIIARYEFNELSIEPRNIRFMVHTGGDGLESQVAWQSLDIRASEMQIQKPPPVIPPIPDSPRPQTTPGTPPNSPTPPKGFIDRVIDFFK